LSVKKNSINALELNVKFVNLVGTNVLDKYKDSPSPFLRGYGAIFAPLFSQSARSN